jgi:hypothetical protein
MYTILNKNSSVPTAQRKWNTVFDINSPYGYNFSICRKELITSLYCRKFTQNPNLFEN